MENKDLIEVYNNLKLSPKRISSKYFYDKTGSILFDQICELEEYYPTTTEISILKNNVSEIAGLFNKNSLLIEFGSGSSIKTDILLGNIPNIRGYIPIDISSEHLHNSVERLKKTFTKTEIFPLALDYTKEFHIPKIGDEKTENIVFFPGSTIGNFTKSEAKEFLGTIAEELGIGGGLLIGIDLKKDVQILENAYNDKLGVTAKFNLNILSNLNNQFGFNFNQNNFYHRAEFNSIDGRIEMYLISRINHTVRNEHEEFVFVEGEKILTEYSHKYSTDEFKQLASSHFTLERIWTDQNNYFAVLYLKVNA